MTITGNVVAARTARVTSADISGSQPKQNPPALILGQEIFTSSPATPGVSSRRLAIIAKSSTVSAEILTIAGTCQCSQSGGYFLMNPLMPGFCSPIAFSIPAGVSVMRGIAFP